MAEAERKLSIKVNIADRPYPLKIDPVEEESIRKAAKIINDEVRELQFKYDGKDKQDFLAMCLLQYATEAMGKQSPASPSIVSSNVRDKAGGKSGSDDIVYQKLDIIDHLLADFLDRQ